MPPSSVVVLLLATCFLVALAGAVLARQHALRRNLLDQPGARRSHAVATPRGGGIGIVVAWVAAWLWLPSTVEVDPALVAAAIAGMVLVAGIGWVDDHRPLSAWSRLLVHAVAAAVVAAATWHVSGSAIITLAAFVAVLVLVNVWNFMDGIDGIAASQALLVALACAWLVPQPAVVLPALVVAASCAGFLPLNAPRARIFMGDVGSGALGFALALLLVLIATQPSTRAADLPLALLPFSAFLIDASLTLARRMLRGEAWWTPHVTHAYQQLASGMGRHWPVTAGYAGWTLVAVAIADRGWGHAPAITIALAIGFCCAGGWAWWAATGRAGHGTDRDVVDD